MLPWPVRQRVRRASLRWGIVGLLAVLALLAAHSCHHQTSVGGAGLAGHSADPDGRDGTAATLAAAAHVHLTATVPDGVGRTLGDPCADCTSHPPGLGRDATVIPIVVVLLVALALVGTLPQFVVRRARIAQPRGPCLHLLCISRT